MKVCFFRFLDRALIGVPIVVFVAFFLYGGSKQKIMSNKKATLTNSQMDITAVNWNSRGAWDDSFRLDFGEGWVFPWGSNHLSSVEVLSCGEVWPRWDDTNKIAGVDMPLAIVPGLTQFSCSRTQDNSYILSWTNAALNRCTNALASAVIELRRSGNRVITFDGVTSTIVRELPFEHYGWGQDNEWVEHFFPDEVAEIEIAGGYTNWVNAIALEPGNGYYKLAVNIGEDPPEIVNLTVGEYSVAVTNAGEYVFLLQKGELYPIDFSFLPDGVSYSYDDGGPSEPPEPDWSELSFRSKSASQEVYYYTFRTIDDDGEGPELILPKRDGSGSMRWYPSLTIDPKSGVLFEYYSFFIATVYDLPFGEYPAFTWESGGKVIGRGDSLYFEDIESYSNEISVTATYRGVVLRGKIIIERHIRETRIELSGGGLIISEGLHLNFEGCPESNSIKNETSIDLNWALTTSGTLRLESECGSNVTVKDSKTGSSISLPMEWRAEENSIGYSNLVARIASPMTDGKFILSFVSDDESMELSHEIYVGLVEIKVEAVATWPVMRNRHVFGPKEEFTITTNPKCEISCLPSGSVDIKGNTITTPRQPGLFFVRLIFDSIVHTCAFNCIAPTGINAFSSVEFSMQDWNDSVGLVPTLGSVAVGMTIQNRLMPDYVSFSKLFYMEGACNATDRWGLFEDPQIELLPHDYTAGAWHEVPVGSENSSPQDYVVGLFDIKSSIPMNGGFRYNITNYWYVKDMGIVGDLQSFSINSQEFSLFVNGDMSVKKYGWIATRGTNNVTIITRSP